MKLKGWEEDVGFSDGMEPMFYSVRIRAERIDIQVAIWRRRDWRKVVRQDGGHVLDAVLSTSTLKDGVSMDRAL